jgi:hypothetical protein
MDADFVNTIMYGWMDVWTVNLNFSHMLIHVVIIIVLATCIISMGGIEVFLNSFVAGKQTYATTFCQGFVVAIQTPANLILSNLSHQPNNFFCHSFMAIHTCGWYLTLGVAKCGYEPNKKPLIPSSLYGVLVSYMFISVFLSKANSAFTRHKSTFQNLASGNIS